MAKIVKIPLVMKNGEKVTDMNSLKKNFDAESVVGFFLDGKLEKWLNDRYYEDEAEAITALDKNDPALAKKLCEVFGVEYEGNDEIDPEEISWRSERIAKLKQLTDDDEVLQNIDAVAFNQEELAELYDCGVERIYLCEGEFRIPKSKQNLEYVVIGNATIVGQQIKQETTEIPEKQYSGAIEISCNIADEIVYRYNSRTKRGYIETDYIETPNYVVVGAENPETSEDCIYRIDKRTGERVVLKTNYTKANANKFAAYNDKIVMPDTNEEDEDIVYLLDLKTMEQTKLPIKMNLYKKGVLTEFYFVALSTNGIQIVDLTTMRCVYVLDEQREKVGGNTIHFDGTHIFILAGCFDSNCLLSYDISSHNIVNTITLPADVIQFNKIIEYDQKFYIYQEPSYGDVVTVYCVDKNNIDGGIVQIHEFEVADICGGEKCAIADGKLFYIDDKQQLWKYSLDDKLPIKLVGNCAASSLCILGDYVYYEDEGVVFKLDLTNLSLSEVINECRVK